jgi:hypothetical protein
MHRNDNHTSYESRSSGSSLHHGNGDPQRKQKQPPRSIDAGLLDDSLIHCA